MRNHRDDTLGQWVIITQLSHCDVTLGQWVITSHITQLLQSDISAIWQWTFREIHEHYYWLLLDERFGARKQTGTERWCSTPSSPPPSITHVCNIGIITLEAASELLELTPRTFINRLSKIKQLGILYNVPKEFDQNKLLGDIEQHSQIFKVLSSDTFSSHVVVHWLATPTFPGSVP